MKAATPSPAVQLTLDLPFEEQLGREDFVVGEANAFALSFIEAWPDWPASVAVLSGPSGSGKTHLGNIWADLSGAHRHKAKALSFAVLEDWVSSGALLLEDCDVPDLDERALFHLINMVRNSGLFLLMTVSQPVSNWDILIPDLKSRLRAAVPVTIGAPDEILMKQVLVKQFADRQIMIDKDVVDYLILRLERSLFAVRDAVRALDELSISKGRAITKRLAAEILTEGWER